MSRPRDAAGIRPRWAEVRVDAEPSAEPRYAITAVAARCGIHVRTLRRYEEFGLVEPAAIEAGLRLYSEADVDRVRRIRRLVDDLGVNLAGAAALLHMREQVIALQRELRALREQIPGD